MCVTLHLRDCVVASSAETSTGKDWRNARLACSTRGHTVGSCRPVPVLELLLDQYLHSKCLRHKLMKGSKAGLYLSPTSDSQ